MRTILAAAVLVVAGCQALGPSTSRGPDVEVPYPAGCAEFGLAPMRCAMIVEELARRAGIEAAQAASIGLLGDPGCGEGAEHQVICTRTTKFVVRARFHMPDGRALDQSQFCGVGGQYSILCNDTPEVQLSVPTDAYFDVPCTGDDVSTCATRFPDPDPGAAAAEHQIAVKQLLIPLDHVGRSRVDVGEGSLANGILEASEMSLDAGGPAYLLSEDGIRLVIESSEPDGRPFDNYYAHGRRDGVERFTARVEFDVQRFEPGATIVLRDIVVR